MYERPETSLDLIRKYVTHKKNLWRGSAASQQTYIIKVEILNKEEVGKG
jgi:hypothetical protein